MLVARIKKLDYYIVPQQLFHENAAFCNIREVAKFAYEKRETWKNFI